MMLLEDLYRLLDITSLDPKDDEVKIMGLARQVRRVYENTGEVFLPAAICVFPNWVAVLKENCYTLPVELAVVAGGFPHGQTLTQVKMLETHAAIEKGATEIDMVLNRGLFLSGKLEDCGIEIKLLKEIAGPRTLKVIIESGELSTEQNITGAAILALHVGADFVKTSTGKSAVGATPEAAKAICFAIRDFYNETGLQRGIKISGGVQTVEQAMEYCEIIESILGAEWLTPGLTRIGASRLANDILIQAGYKDLAEF
jgi:deoxyribose-phosphate aldolase